MVGFRSAFPDLRITIEDILEEGDRVAMRWSATGTHRGPYRGIQATGRQVSWSGLAIDRVADGKIAERWGLIDFAGLMAQLQGTNPR